MRGISPGAIHANARVSPIARTPAAIHEAMAMVEQLGLQWTLRPRG
jgi:hypothetical protein